MVIPDFEEDVQKLRQSEEQLSKLSSKLNRFLNSNQQTKATFATRDYEGEVNNSVTQPRTSKPMLDRELFNDSEYMRRSPSPKFGMRSKQDDQLSFHSAALQGPDQKINYKHLSYTADKLGHQSTYPGIQQESLPLFSSQYGLSKKPNTTQSFFDIGQPNMSQGAFGFGSNDFKSKQNYSQNHGQRNINNIDLVSDQIERIRAENQTLKADNEQPDAMLAERAIGNMSELDFNGKQYEFKKSQNGFNTNSSPNGIYSVTKGSFFKKKQNEQARSRRSRGLFNLDEVPHTQAELYGPIPANQLFSLTNNNQNRGSDGQRGNSKSQNGEQYISKPDLVNNGMKDMNMQAGNFSSDKVRMDHLINGQKKIIMEMRQMLEGERAKNSGLETQIYNYSNLIGSLKQNISREALKSTLNQALDQDQQQWNQIQTQGQMNVPPYQPHDDNRAFFQNPMASQKESQLSYQNQFNQFNQVSHSVDNLPNNPEYTSLGQQLQNINLTPEQINNIINTSIRQSRKQSQKPSRRQSQLNLFQSLAQPVNATLGPGQQNNAPYSTKDHIIEQPNFQSFPQSKRTLDNELSVGFNLESKPIQEAEKRASRKPKSIYKKSVNLRRLTNSKGKKKASSKANSSSQNKIKTELKDTAKKGFNISSAKKTDKRVKSSAFPRSRSQNTLKKRSGLPYSGSNNAKDDQNLGKPKQGGALMKQPSTKTLKRSVKQIKSKLRPTSQSIKKKKKLDSDARVADILKKERQRLIDKGLTIIKPSNPEDASFTGQADVRSIPVMADQRDEQQKRAGMVQSMVPQGFKRNLNSSSGQDKRAGRSQSKSNSQKKNVRGLQAFRGMGNSQLSGLRSGSNDSDHQGKFSLTNYCYVCSPNK